MADIRTLKLNLLADTSDFKAGLAGSERATKEFAGRVGSFTRKAASAFAILEVAVIAVATRIGKDAMTAASDLNESLSKTSVIFGNVSDDIKIFAQKTAKSFGISQSAALDAASEFATFGKAAGLRGPELANFSKKLVGLAADFASFYNTSPEEAIYAIGAALRGENEPIRRYGILLNDAALKQAALSEGLYTGKGNLDAQSKVLSAYSVILAQSTDAQGDFSRTADGVANSTRILTASIEDAKSMFGQALIPVVQSTIPLFERMVGILSGKGPEASTANMNGAIADMKKNMFGGTDSFAYAILEVAKAFGTLWSQLIGSDAANANDTLGAFAKVLGAVAWGINRIADAIKELRGAYDKWQNMPKWLKASGPVGILGALVDQGLNPRAAGGPVSANRAYLVGERGPELFIPNGNGVIANANRTAGMGGGGVTIIMNGIVDAESARRSIENLIQRSQRRTGPINWAGAVS